MKKIFLITAAIMLNSQVSLANEIGTVMVLKGDADLIHNNKAVKIKTGLAVSEGDRVETKPESYVKIVMKDRNVIVVTAGTKLAINQYQTEKDNKQVAMSVEQGSVRHALVQKYTQKNEKYEVRTATTVAGVRGTDFLTEYNIESGDSVLCALEGKVSLDALKNGKPEEKPVVVEAGNFVRFKKGDKVPKVIKTNPAWLEKALKLHSLE